MGRCQNTQIEKAFARGRMVMGKHSADQEQKGGWWRSGLAPIIIPITSDHHTAFLPPFRIPIKTTKVSPPAMVITTQDPNASSIMNHNNAFLVLPCPTSASLLAGLPLPRTGKRGVPQQFPRRLYEMLDGETANQHDDDISNNTHHLIEWSASGKAFRIRNVEAFASTVLPKYFRTKKFSSFQRNLNLVRNASFGRSQ
jgi:hypothetical protein